MPSACLCTPGRAGLARAKLKLWGPYAGVLTILSMTPFPLPGPCFLSPGLPGLLALTVPEPLGGDGKGRWPGRPLPPPTRCCFPLWGSQELFEDIFSLCDYFTLDADFCFCILMGVAAGPLTSSHPCPPCPSHGCPALRYRGPQHIAEE